MSPFEQLDSFLDNLVGPETVGALVDLGCGDGRDLRRLAAQAPDAARFAGITLPTDRILELWSQNPDPRITYIGHDLAEGIPLADGSVDVVYSRDLVECIVDKQALVREIHRVLKPGGRVVCAHHDWDSAAFDGEYKPLVREVVAAFNDLKQNWMADCDAWMGRRLWRTFQQSGLFEGEVRAHVQTETRYEPGNYGYNQAQSFATLVRRGLIDEAKLTRFLDGLQCLADDGIYFYSITMYVYAGKPR